MAPANRHFTGANLSTTWLSVSKHGHFTTPTNTHGENTMDVQTNPIKLTNNKGQLCAIISANDEGGCLTLYSTENGQAYIEFGITDGVGRLTLRSDDGREVGIDAYSAAWFTREVDNGPIAEFPGEMRSVFPRAA
jgi:hypothetical protein